MTARKQIADSLAVLGSAKVTISTATTTAFDFGTPNDLDLASLAGYRPGDRILAVMTASTGGTTDDLTFVAQDADDNAGSIGTPATAETEVVGSDVLAGGTGDHMIALDVQLKPARPWLRFAVTSDGTTDTFVCSCVVIAVPQAGV